jgi:cysteine desulfurase
MSRREGINMGDVIYFDNASTAPISKKALESAMPFFEMEWGNPSSDHVMGKKAYEAVEDARAKIAKIINANPDEIYFTSGGTESNNIAIRGYRQMHPRTLFITDLIEHHSVGKFKEEVPFWDLEIIKNDSNGQINKAQLKETVTEDSLTAIMHVNNEIGTIQDIPAISKIVHSNRGCLMVDAVQSMGHMPVDVKTMGCDILTASAHKFGGFGSGFLFVKQGTVIHSIMRGGNQENSIRPGTLFVPGIVAMATALEDSVRNLEEKISHLEKLNHYFAGKIMQKFSCATVNNYYANGNYYPGSLNVRFCGFRGEEILQFLSQFNICASSGSACNSGSNAPSHVLMAIGLSSAQAESSIRFSLGAQNTFEEVDRVLQILETYFKAKGVL